MPENIRYGVTITPPDGDPVTGMANLEPPLDNFVVAGTCATNILNTYPSSYDDSTSASWTINLEANTCYEMVVQIYNMTFRYTDGSGTHSIPYSGEGSSSGGNPASSHYIHAKTGADGRIIIQKGSVNNYFSVMIFKANNVLSASNIKAGITISGVEGTANEMPNSFATFSNWMYYRGYESGARGSYCWDKTNATSYAQGTASNYTYTANYPQSNVIVFANTLQDEDNPYPAGITADSGTLSENNGGYGYLVGAVTGHVLTFDPPSRGNTSCFTFVYSRPDPGYYNLKPENIAYGVTITPPGGSPVTGTCVPYSAFKYYSSSYRSSATSFSYDGFYPEGVSDEIYKTGGNDASVTIKSTSPYECLVMAYGRSLQSAISGNYTGEVDSLNDPPTIFKTSITSSGLIFSKSLISLGVGLTSVIGNELSADVIKEGVTINGITGTMKGATIAESAFAFLDWHRGGYGNGKSNYPSKYAGGGDFCTITVNGESSATFTNFNKTYTNWMVLYRGATNPINFVVNGSATQLTNVQNMGAYGCGTTTSPITSATLNNNSATANAFVIFF